MALSRKTQPDRPIWPVAPDAGGSPVREDTRTATGHRASAPASGNGQRTAGTTTSSESFGSLES